MTFGSRGRLRLILIQSPAIGFFSLVFVSHQETLVLGARRCLVQISGCRLCPITITAFRRDACNSSSIFRRMGRSSTQNPVVNGWNPACLASSIFIRGQVSTTSQYGAIRLLLAAIFSIIFGVFFIADFFCVRLFDASLNDWKIFVFTNSQTTHFPPAPVCVPSLDA